MQYVYPLQKKNFKLTWGWISQLSTDHSSIRRPPQVVTHRTPSRVEAYFYSTSVGRRSPDQSYSAGAAAICYNIYIYIWIRVVVKMKTAFNTYFAQLIAEHLQNKTITWYNYNCMHMRRHKFYTCYLQLREAGKFLRWTDAVQFASTTSHTS